MKNLKTVSRAALDVSGIFSRVLDRVAALVADAAARTNAPYGLCRQPVRVRVHARVVDRERR